MQANLTFKFIRIFLHIACLLLIAAAAHGQVRFYTVVSESELSGAQTFQLQYIVEGASDIRKFQVPNFPGFRVYDVFDRNSSSIDAATANFVEVYSKIVVLTPRRTGRFTIPGASAIINGKKMRSNAVKVIVRANGISAISAEDGSEPDVEAASELRPNESIEDKIKKNVFLRVEVNKTACYVGECLMATYKMYSRLNATSQVMKRPSFSGFSVVEMVDAYDSKPDVEQFEGAAYYVNLIRKVQLFPLQEGDFILDPAEVESVIHFMKIDESADARKGNLKNFPASAATRQPYNHRAMLETEPVHITVKPLPRENQPQNFSGAIGSLNLSAHLANTQVHSGDLVKLQLVVSGIGNLPLITSPVIKWPIVIDTAEPDVKEQTNKYVFPLQGTKTFEYSFTAPPPGDYQIPAAQLPYYDPQQKVYKTASSDSFLLHVINAEKPKEDLAPPESSSKLPPRQLYWFALIVAVIVGGIVYQVWLMKRPARSASGSKVSTEKTVPVAIHPLTAARNAFNREQPVLFYRELQRALWNAVSEKHKIPPSSLNKQNIASILGGGGASRGTINELLDILRECEWSSYAPEHEGSNAAKLLERAEVVIEKL